MGASTRNTDEYPIHLWIAANVAARRTELGLTQKEVAERMTTGQAYFAHLEAGRVNATVEVLWKLAKALDTDPSTLVDTPENAAKRFKTQKSKS